MDRSREGLSHLRGLIADREKYLGKTTSRHLADPIRHWFLEHPDEIAPENYFSATFRRQPDGSYRCFLELMGKHHWQASESGPTLPHALRRSLEQALPDISLSEWDNRE